MEFMTGVKTTDLLELCLLYTSTSLLGPAALLRYGYPLMAACPILLFTMWKKEA